MGPKFRIFWETKSENSYKMRDYQVFSLEERKLWNFIKKIREKYKYRFIVKDIVTNMKSWYSWTNYQVS